MHLLVSPKMLFSGSRSHIWLPASSDLTNDALEDIVAHAPGPLAPFGCRIEVHAHRNYSASLVSLVLRNLAKYDFSPTNRFFVEMQVEIHGAIEGLAQPDTGSCFMHKHTHTNAMTQTAARPQLQVALHWQLLSSTYCDQERFPLGGWHKHTHSSTAAATHTCARTHTLITCC